MKTDLAGMNSLAIPQHYLPPRAAEQSQGGRILWLDLARGMAIILVVVGHVERGLVSAHIAKGEVWRWMDYAIYTFHMPVFFLLAGLTASMSLGRKSRQAFVGEKIWTIAYPYILWSIIQGVVMYALSTLTNSKESIHDIFSIGWQPIGQFWFLYVLMIYQIIGALLHRHKTIFLLLALCLYLPASIIGSQTLFANLAHYMIFYTAGFFDLAGIVAFLGGSRSVIIPLFLCGFAMSTYLSGVQDHGNFASILALPATLFGLGLTLAVAQSIRSGPARFLAALGAASMTIYVLHILFGAGARIAMKVLHVPEEPWLYLAVASSIGVGGPYVVHDLLQRYRLLAPLGLASRPKPALRPKLA